MSDGDLCPGTFANTFFNTYFHLYSIFFRSLLKQLLLCNGAGVMYTVAGGGDGTSFFLMLV